VMLFNLMTSGLPWPRGAILVTMDLTEAERNYQAVLNLLEVLQRFGTVKRPSKVLPFPEPQPKPS
jgi:hypothetical protein